MTEKRTNQSEVMNDQRIQIQVRFGERSVVLSSLTQESLVEELYRVFLQSQFLPRFNQDLQLYNGNRAIELSTESHRQTLGDIKINDGTVLKAIIGLKGGIDPRTGAKLIKSQLPELKPLDNYISLTRDACMISLDDDPDTYRAKMPCGHAISAASMIQYCRSLLDEKQHTFKCPHINTPGKEKCNYIWDFFMVRHVAALSDEELHQFETRITENYLNAVNGVQECPGCGVYCRRINPQDPMANCRLCTRSLGINYNFCWYCLELWNNPRTVGGCGNPGCKNEDRRIALLRECKMKEIGNVMAPSLRACPACGMLIYHREWCSHMTCEMPTCKHNFCFLCLKPMKDGRWQCPGYESKCQVAPIQTYL